MNQRGTATTIISLTLVFLLFNVVINLSAVYGQETYNPSSEFGNAQTDPNPLKSPSGISMSSSLIFVADTGNNQVQGFSLNGSTLGKISAIELTPERQQQLGISKLEMAGPQGVAIDANGSLYVADTGNNRILKFGNDGLFRGAITTAGQQLGPFNSPHGLAVDPLSNNVYVADSGNNRVIKTSPSGQGLTVIGSGAGSEDGKFNQPYGLAVDASGNVFVTDFNNHRVQKFSSTGTFMSKFGDQNGSSSPAPSPSSSTAAQGGILTSPAGISVDPSGNVYVADSATHMVLKYSNDGTFVTSFGTQGTGPGQLNAPDGVAVDPADPSRIYVVDGGNNRVQVFASSGQSTPQGPGAAGQTGPGAAGQTGPGAAGPTGPGAAGQTGPGAAGQTGPGAAGPTGPGAAGPTGPGAAGPTGPGAAGPTGPGAAGQTGPGAAGQTGPGAAGQTGPGAAGQTGPGAAGPTGGVGLQPSQPVPEEFDNSIFTGPIKSVLFTGPTTWIAEGDWRMSMANGAVKSFDTDMTWYNANGSGSHTHEVRNFRWNGPGGGTVGMGVTGAGPQSSVAGTISPLNVDTANASKVFVANGVADVGTNGVLTWFSVPVTLTLGGEKTLSFVLGDPETNNHFARQNMYGVVAKVTPCGDTPGANMQVLPRCEIAGPSGGPGPGAAGPQGSTLPPSGGPAPGPGAAGPQGSTLPPSGGPAPGPGAAGPQGSTLPPSGGPAPGPGAAGPQGSTLPPSGGPAPGPGAAGPQGSTLPPSGGPTGGPGPQ